jgi:hypothetical protein
MEDESLGLKFWLLLAGGCVAAGIGLLVVFLVIGATLEAWGVFGALIFFSVIALAYGWLYDRRQERRYGDLPVEQR